MEDQKKIYFLSDFHLGAPNFEASLIREKKIVSFLESIQNECAHLYLMGDLFDFWFEYKNAIPKGSIRLLGQLARMCDNGIPITIFKGNHDLWMEDYFTKEFNAEIITQELVREHFGHQLYMHHGDGLGPGDYGYKFIKKIFTNPFFKWCFHRLHPNFGIGLANYFSNMSSKKSRVKDEIYLGKDNEWLVQHCQEISKTNDYDYMIFGHRHLPLKIEIAPNSYYINLGDWLSHFTYAVLDKNGLQLLNLKGMHVTKQVN